MFNQIFFSSVEFLKLKSSKLPRVMFLVSKAVCIQMFMTRYLFKEISENKHTEYLTPTYNINSDYANVVKFAKGASNLTQLESKET